MITYEEISSLSATTVLSFTSPVQLYVNDISETEKRWKKLAQIWHPDKHSGDITASRVFTHVKQLYERAVGMIQDGVWGSGKHVKFESTSAWQHFHYQTSDVTDSGVQYVGRNHVLYHIPDSNFDLVKIWEKNFEKAKAGIKLDSEIVNNFGSVIGKIKVTKLVDGDFTVVVGKKPEYLRLQDVLDKKGPLMPEHVAWIITRLMGYSMHMHLLDIPNLNICTRSVFIDPGNHQVILADGWEFTPGFNVPILACPRKTIRMCPDISNFGQAKRRHIIAQIKALGRTCLGDPIGVNLQKRDDLKGKRLGFVSWLNSPSFEDCLEQFKKWEKIRDTAFGPPKFVIWNLTEKEIYA